MGSLMSHFNMSWEDATNRISYQNAIMLSASVPRLKTRKEKKKEEEKSKDVHAFEWLAAFGPTDNKK